MKSAAKCFDVMIVFGAVIPTIVHEMSNDSMTSCGVLNMDDNTSCMFPYFVLWFMMRGLGAALPS